MPADTRIPPRHDSDHHARQDGAAAEADAAGTPSSVHTATEELLRGRERQELADLQVRRGIFSLSDLGVPQRQIAATAGLSQAEVSRRLSRRDLMSTQRTPREIILERRVGFINTRQMLNELVQIPLSAEIPGEEAAYDGAASARGTAKQLIEAFHEGLIDDHEYEEVRARASRRNKTS